jgi:hypothetical protein
LPFQSLAFPAGKGRMKNLRFEYTMNTSTPMIHCPIPLLALYFAFLAALTFLAGCAGSKIPSLYDTNPVLLNKQYTVEEITKIEQNFNENPKQYSQELGNLILWRMYKKNSEFARKFAQTPELKEGIDEKKAKAMVGIYNLIKDQDISTNLFEDKGSDDHVHQIIMEWSGNIKSNWSGTIYLRKSGNLTGKILDVQPIGCEQGEDEIDQESWRKAGNLSWKSLAGQEDTDGIAFSLEFPLHKKLEVSINKQVLRFSPADVSAQDLVFDEKDGLKGRLIVKNARKTNFSKELLALRDMVLAGKGDQRFSAPLQALLWGYMDGYFRDADNPFKNYYGPLDFVKPIWGKMEGQRWEDFETVTSRLNLPELVDYYELMKFKYIYSSSRGEDILAVTIFKERKGSCGFYASFAKYCLRKAGYDAAGLRFRWGVEAHHIVVYTEKGKHYSLDRARRKVGILGPFDTIAEILKANQKGPTWEIRFW